MLSRVRLFVTPWTIQSMEFSRPESTFPSPGDLPNPGIKPRSPALQPDCLPVEPPGKLNSWLSGFLKAGHKSVDVLIHLSINAYVYTFTALCLRLILLPLLNLSSIQNFYFKYTAVMMRIWSSAGHVFTVLLPSQTSPSPLKAPQMFLWCQYLKKEEKKNLWKNIIIQTQRKEIRRLALRYVKIIQPFIYLGVEMFCLEEGDGWCLPQTPRS